MKRKITILASVLMLCAFLIPLGMRGQTTVTWTASEQGYENAQIITSIDIDSNVAGEFFKGTNNNEPKYYNTGSAIRCYGGNYFTIMSSDGNLSQITLTFGSGDGNNAITTDVGSYADGTWLGDAEEVTFTIGGTTGHRRIAAFEVTYGGEGPAVAMPTFNPAAGIYTEPQSVTISCETGGASIYYTTDGTTPDNASTLYQSAISISETTTLKAIAYVGTDASNVATAVYTILTPMSIAEVRAQGTGNVFTSGVVTSCVGTTGYIQDATAAICVYGTALTVGDNITVQGSLSTYNGLLEIMSPQVTVISPGNTVEPQVMTIEAINADYAGENALQGWLVRVENATVTAISGQNTTIAQGENTIVVRGISSDVTYAVNDILSLTANIGCFNAAQLANPQNVEVQINTDPVINAEDITLAYDATSGEIAYTIDNPVGGVTLTATTEADWITNITVNSENVTFNTTANLSSENRTAVFTLSYTGATNKTVTVTQEHFVADYATLPFAFDGGRDDIEGTAGLTQEGLGSDYNNSPKLRFDNTGDWLLLHFNEAPGTLTFDIKGNSFSGGTFTVQTSEDGVTYTDLETYTELGGTQSKSFDNLGENVRYIKWIYTEKDNGNVALGNIMLYEFGGGPVIETYDLTIEPFENLEIFTFVGGDESDPFEGAGTIQVTEGDQVMLSVSAVEGYVMQSLIVDGVEHVNDIDEDLTYSFNMPSHNVTITATAVADIPFEPATYTLATTIESGRTYIIVGSKTIDSVTNYYAMGEQRNNNRGGVAISVDGTTATVETANVYEFVITALEEEGFYSIYDARTPGYLYAASNSSNNLKTETELDTIGNGAWEISINDTTSVVASNSSNRNVMQFNYNGGNTLFSCYSSASQLPVSLYVKDETPTVVTQTIALGAGANWCSFNVEVALDDLKAILVEAAPGATSANPIMISSQNQNVRYNGMRWLGSLNFDLSKMYRITVPVACEITVEGMPIDPASYPVEIAPGTNWIAYPLNTNMQVSAAFAGFAVNGDVVKHQNGNASYRNNRWLGSFEMQPGKGYKYVSADTETKTYTFPIAK
jgi:hypothetical protein